MAKRLCEEQGISVCETEWRLDENLFLDELPQLDPGRLHCPYLYERMFAHVEAAGQRKPNCGICLGCQQPSPGRDFQAEVPTPELLTQETSQEEAIALYHEVCQLKRSPREVPCSTDTEEETHMEILKTLREYFWCRWDSTQPDRETR